jgi:hypothetical protein
MKSIDDLRVEIQKSEQECNKIAKEIDAAEKKYDKLMLETSKKRNTLKQQEQV